MSFEIKKMNRSREALCHLSRRDEYSKVCIMAYLSDEVSAKRMYSRDETKAWLATNW